MTLFTVFTPTYNRAHTINRVFESLCAQTLRDFEWLVVDDGSTDNTAELIAGWTKEADFPIRYFRQNHLGKHVAHNLAAREARGQLFLTFDSDDACVPNVLERIAYHWSAIPPLERQSFFAVVGLCCDQNGRIVGDVFPSDPFDSNLREKNYVYHVRGEKWGAGLTEVIRRYPFPEIEHTNFAPEGIVWLEIAKTYRTRYVNEKWRVYHINDPDTGATLTNRTSLDDNAPGRLHYCLWLLDNDLTYFFHSPTPFLKAAVMLPIVSWSSGERFWHSLVSLQKMSARVLVLAVFPLSSLLHVFHRSIRAGRELRRHARAKTARYIKSFISRLPWGLRKLAAFIGLHGHIDLIRSRPAFVGVYKSFDDVPASARVNADYAVDAAEINVRTFKIDEPTGFPILGQSHSLLPLAASMLENRKKLRILDFGGAAGVDFGNLTKAIPDRMDLQYHVVDLLNVCVVGRRHWEYDERISFGDKMPNNGEQFDIVYSCCALQYVPEPLELLNKFKSYDPKCVILADVPYILEGSFVRLQINRGPIPAWVLSLSDVRRVMLEGGYRLAFHVASDADSNVDNYPSEFRVPNLANLLFLKS